MKRFSVLNCLQHRSSLDAFTPAFSQCSLKNKPGKVVNNEIKVFQRLIFYEEAAVQHIARRFRIRQFAHFLHPQQSYVNNPVLLSQPPEMWEGFQRTREAAVQQLQRQRDVSIRVFVASSPAPRQPDKFYMKSWKERTLTVSYENCYTKQSELNVF